MIKRYLIFEKRYTSLKSEGIEKEYAVVPELDVKEGIVVPATDPLLIPEPVGVIDATTPAEALEKYQESLVDRFM